MKKEVRMLGIDDSPFDKWNDRYVRIFGAYFRGGDFIDGVLSGKVRVDGNNSTRILSDMIIKSKFRSDLKCLFLGGIALGGFNVVDINKLYDATKVPVIVVMRKKPDVGRIKRILEHLGMHRKALLLDKAGMPFKLGRLYVQLAGITPEEADVLIRISSTRSNLPEPLRVAHLIGAGFVFGESKGNA